MKKATWPISDKAVMQSRTLSWTLRSNYGNLYVWQWRPPLTARWHTCTTHCIIITHCTIKVHTDREKDQEERDLLQGFVCVFQEIHLIDVTPPWTLIMQSPHLGIAAQPLLKTLEKKAVFAHKIWKLQNRRNPSKEEFWTIAQMQSTARCLTVFTSS